MGKRLFISDGDLIIDLFMCYNFLGTYINFYKETYDLELQKEILNSFGFLFNDSEIKLLDPLFKNYDIKNEFLQADILLMVKVLIKRFTNIKNRGLQKLHEDELMFIGEIFRLNELLLNELDGMKIQPKSISLKFRRGSGIKARTIENPEIISYIMTKLKEFLEMKEQKVLLVNLKLEKFKWISILGEPL